MTLKQRLCALTQRLRLTTAARCEEANRRARAFERNSHSGYRISVLVAAVAVLLVLLMVSLLVAK